MHKLKKGNSVLYAKISLNSYYSLNIQVKEKKTTNKTLITHTVAPFYLEQRKNKNT